MLIYNEFGMRANPFSTTPDPQFAYETNEHRLALTKIVYHIQERMGLMLLRGDLGTGKTTLSRFLLQSLPKEQYTIAYLTGLKHRTEAAFMRAINEGFGLPTPFKAADIHKVLLAFLIEQHKAGKTVVLMIDEAQMILAANLHVLHNLLNHETSQHKLLQIVLYAQPNFGNKLEQLPALKSRVTTSVYLNPLSYDDAMDMLRYRVAQVSDEPKPGQPDTFDKVFPAGDLRDIIYKAGKGIPRDLCVISSSAMVSAYALRQNHVTQEALASALKDFRDLKFDVEEGHTNG